MNTVANPFPSSNAMPRDLREGSPGGAGAGKIYPVDPAAVEKLKAHMAAARETAVSLTRQVKAEPKPARQPPTLGVLNPAEIYPAEVLAAAKEPEATGGRRNIAAVLTPEVLAIWDRWNQSGVTMKKIGLRKHNGLINVTTQQVSDYLRKYREGQVAPAGPTTETQTAVAPPAAEPDPELEVEPIETAVAPFAAEKSSLESRL